MYYTVRYASTWPHFPWKEVFLRDVPRGFLQAVGILPLPSYAGAYWARKESTGEWELRVPYKPGGRPF
jgi:hypothetical protein